MMIRNWCQCVHGECLLSREGFKYDNNVKAIMHFYQILHASYIMSWNMYNMSSSMSLSPPRLLGPWRRLCLFVNRIIQNCIERSWWILWINGVDLGGGGNGNWCQCDHERCHCCRWLVIGFNLTINMKRMINAHCILNLFIVVNARGVGVPRRPKSLSAPKTATMSRYRYFVLYMVLLIWQWCPPPRTYII